MEEVLPLKTLEEAVYAKTKIPAKYFSVPLAKRVPCRGPKTLLCHDMKGGYLEDRFVHGVKDKGNCFNFVHWSVVDIFVYFSHNLITIPPDGWISAAHKNGTLVLGTFITEWDDGAKICEEFLADMASIEALCDSLVWIAMNSGFDGWLINIENKIKFSQVRCLIEFVSLLTERLHKVKEDALVIWYDSVLESGELTWQNCLNEENRVFFDNCDGIFLNYNWTEQNLKTSVTEAGNRLTDVYVGVDVFGRGCPGGGGFNTNIALKAIRRHGLSAAIFAPGWIYECLDIECFWENTYKFWDSLEKFCPVRKLQSLPFSTTFCPGYGKKMYRNGKEVTSESWFNLGLQQIQPSFQHGEKGSFKKSVMLTSEDAFNGGGCLKLNCSIPECSVAMAVQSFKIMSTHFTISQCCFVAYTFKSLSLDTDFALTFIMRNHQKEPYILRLAATQGKASTTEMNSMTLLPYEDAECCLPESQVDDWITRHFVLDALKYKGHAVENVNAEIHCIETEMPHSLTMLLGHLEITPTQPLEDSCRATTVYERSESSEINIQCDLAWNDSESVCCWDIFYELQENKEEYLGTSSMPLYRCNLKLKEAEVKRFSYRIKFHFYPQEYSMIKKRKCQNKQSVLSFIVGYPSSESDFQFLPL